LPDRNISATLATAKTPQLAYELIQIDQVDLSAISSMGRDVLRRRKPWVIGRSPNFIAFADSLPELSALIDEAEYAYKRAGEWFQSPPSDGTRALLVTVKDDKMWRKMTRRYGLRPDGLAMQVGRELYLKDDPEQVKRPDRIAHEVIHLRLSDMYGNRLPLWLDEGLAGHYGWLCAVEYNAGRNVVLIRNDPAFAEKELLSLEDLLSIRRYPGNPDSAKAFYRQAEELTGILANRLPPRDLSRFIEEMTIENDSIIAQFRAAARLDENAELKVIEEMRMNMRSADTPAS
jgi:hypothetical protein